jgi:pentalenene oxygenase
MPGTRTPAGRGPLDLLPALGILTADVTLACLFSDLDGTPALRTGHHDLPEALNVVVDGKFARMISPLPALAALPTPGSRRCLHAMELLHQLVRQTISRYRLTSQGGGLLRTMMAAHDEGRGFSDQELHDQIITLLLGGTETTAVLLAWIFHLLDQNPGTAGRLHAEVDEVLGGRPVTSADLGRLTHTRNIVAEGLRLYSRPGC